jgi:hypothetical protein
MTPIDDRIDASWNQYEKLILNKLDEHTKAIKEVHDEIVNIKVEMGVAKTKLSIIGIVSGMFSGIAATFFASIMGR